MGLTQCNSHSAFTYLWLLCSPRPIFFINSDYSPSYCQMSSVAPLWIFESGLQTWINICLHSYEMMPCPLFKYLLTFNNTLQHLWSFSRGNIWWKPRKDHKTPIRIWVWLNQDGLLLFSFGLFLTLWGNNKLNGCPSLGKTNNEK